MVKEKRQMVVGNDNMLYSIVIVLTPTREATVRATMGHQAHAAFLRTVQEADSALAEAHSPKGQGDWRRSRPPEPESRSRQTARTVLD